MKHGKELAYAFRKIQELGADRATYYVTPRTTIRVTRVKCHRKRFVVCIGPPNYIERANMKKWNKEGTPLSKIDIVVWFRGKKK